MPGIFVYGTLLRGECRHHIIAAAETLRIVAARTPGRLVLAGEDLDEYAGGYPGLLPPRTDSQWVAGEYVEVAEVERLLPRLDFVEHYDVRDEAGSLYLRRVVDVVLEDESAERAWTYLFNGSCDPRAIIASGDWRRR